MRPAEKIPAAVYAAATDAGRRWITRAHTPAQPNRPAEELLSLVRLDEARGNGRRAIWIGADYAALDVSATYALTGQWVYPPCPQRVGLDRPCRVFAGPSPCAPDRLHLCFVPLAPYGIWTFRNVAPFWGAIRSDERPLPDFSYSVEVKARGWVDRLLARPHGGLDVGRRRFDLVDLSAAPRPRAVAHAIRRARLGCVFRSNGSYWAAIDQGPSDK